MRKKIPTIDRFSGKTDLDSQNCLIWKGGKTKAGYGMIGHKGRSIGAHVFAWMHSRGQEDIPTGFEVCHTCNNPSCVNPRHLYLATHKDNCSRKRKFIAYKPRTKIMN